MRAASLRLRAGLLALSACLLAAGCGGDDSSGEEGLREATLVLDFVAGPAHLGIFSALDRGLYEEEGIDLEVVEPSSTADTLRLIEAGRAELGLADGIDVATQVDAGRGAKAVMAIAQRPLGGLITLRSSGMRRPAGLEGGTVGVTGVPSDQALVDTVVRSADGDPDRVERVTIGFAGVRALQAGSVDAFTGFIPADAVQVEEAGMPTRSFAFDRWGAPQYPGLVAFTTEERIDSSPELIDSFVRATVAGYEGALQDPEDALEALLEANPGIDPGFAAASGRAMLPFFTVPGVPFGALREDELEAMSRFLVDEGLASEPIAPDRYAHEVMLR